MASIQCSNSIVDNFLYKQSSIQSKLHIWNSHCSELEFQANKFRTKLGPKCELYKAASYLPHARKVPILKKIRYGLTLSFSKPSDCPDKEKKWLQGSQFILLQRGKVPST